jgi:hypothetical protein
LIQCPGNRSAGNDPRNHKGYRNELASLLTQTLICFEWLERAGVDAPTTAGLETGATLNDLIRRVPAGRGRVGGGFPRVSPVAIFSLSLREGVRLKK